jgi:hypothetical protein
MLKLRTWLAAVVTTVYGPVSGIGMVLVAVSKVLTGTNWKKTTPSRAYVTVQVLTESRKPAWMKKRYVHPGTRPMSVCDTVPWCASNPSSWLRRKYTQDVTPGVRPGQSVLGNEVLQSASKTVPLKLQCGGAVSKFG